MDVDCQSKQVADDGTLVEAFGTIARSAKDHDGLWRVFDEMGKLCHRLSVQTLAINGQMMIGQSS